MKSITTMLALCAGLTIATGVSAAPAVHYNDPGRDNAQYRQCLSFSTQQYTGGGGASLIKGQSKAQAWCTCMWNETPENFKGELLKFSETAKGKATGKQCEAYSGWG